MTWDDTIRLFGQEDISPDEMMFRLSVEFPDFSSDDLLSVFDVLIAGMSSKKDIRMTNSLLNGVSSTVGKLRILRTLVDTGTYYFSDIAFRNIYRIMFESSEIDNQVLFKPDFFHALDDRVERLRNAINTYNSVTLDQYEKLVEFRDKLAEKIKLHSGVI